MDIANFEPSRGIEVKRATSALMIARRAASSDPKWLRSFCLISDQFLEYHLKIFVVWIYY